jgi:hypothetical protein
MTRRSAEISPLSALASLSNSDPARQFLRLSATSLSSAVAPKRLSDSFSFVCADQGAAQVSVRTAAVDKPMETGAIALLIRVNNCRSMVNVRHRSPRSLWLSPGTMLLLVLRVSMLAAFEKSYARLESQGACTTKFRLRALRGCDIYNIELTKNNGQLARINGGSLTSSFAWFCCKLHKYNVSMMLNELYLCISYRR